MKRSGVFATKEEMDLLRAILRAPVLAVGAIGPTSPAEECHRLAVKHGLPEMAGMYGIVPSGEFVS